MKIGIDLMGGDNLKDIVSAVNKYCEESNNEVYAFTTEDNKNNENLIKRDNLKIITCENHVTMHDNPALVVRQKKNSTMIVGGKYLQEKKVDAFISAGNTGALVSTGVFVVKRMPGVSRPALPALFPKINGNTPFMMLDLGANVEPTLEHMLDYVKLSKLYMKEFYNIDNPEVKLINIGEEDSKGTEFYKNLHKTLQEDESINFTGNIEPRYLLETKADIILMDGWTGNIIIKTLEGSLKFLGENLKEVIYKNMMTKIAGGILKPGIKEFAKQLNYKELGATPVLGVNGLLLKAHGSSDKQAFLSALRRAEQLHNLQLMDKLNNAIQTEK